MEDDGQQKMVLCSGDEQYSKRKQTQHKVMDSEDEIGDFGDWFVKD
jgi:hypothetical protein